MKKKPPVKKMATAESYVSLAQEMRGLSPAQQNFIWALLQLLSEQGDKEGVRFAKMFVRDLKE